MRVALIYDRVNKIGGAERVLEVLHEIFPEAPLYTAVYNPETAPWAKKFKIIPSFLQKFPLAKSRHEVFPYLMPIAFESFSFDEYDLVISITSEAAKGILTKPQTLHLCYCLTPTRYLWSGYEDYFRTPVFKFFSFPLVAYLKRWDKVACQRPDVYLAISENVKKRIKHFYHRDSEILYPPVDLEKFQIPNSPGLAKRSGAGKSQTNSKFKIQNSKYFLVVSRLVSYKRVDLVIEAFNQLGLPLKIIGKGIQETILKRKAKRNIEFLGQLTDRELLGYHQKSQAVIFPQEEDFGLVPLEAQACGKPVIAYKSGGALETIIEGRTGEFFSPQTSKALVKVIKGFKAAKYQPKDCRQQAEKFGKEIFKKKFKEIAENLTKQKQK